MDLGFPIPAIGKAALSPPKETFKLPKSYCNTQKKQPLPFWRTAENETGFSHLLHIPFHRSPAEAIRLHHPDKPEGDAMDTR
jgi:hypothetical protein